MKTKYFSLGFTLLEVVMTFVLLAIVAVIAVSTFSGGVTRTDVPVRQLQTDASLQLVLENMIADKEYNFSMNLDTFSNSLGDVNVVTSKYAKGTNYVLTEKRFVCPQDHTFVDMPGSNQFLLITIKPDVHSGVSLTYIFNSAVGNCNFFNGS